MLWALGTVREGVIAEEGGNAERRGNGMDSFRVFPLFGNADVITDLRFVLVGEL